VRLGLMYVNGLRQEVGKAIEACTDLSSECGMRSAGSGEAEDAEHRCPKCGCDDPTMIEPLHTAERFCNVCSYLWRASMRSNEPAVAAPDPASRIPRTERFGSLDALVRRTGIRRDEIATLAEIGALNSFGYDRRTALWQVEQAIRPAGALFEGEDQESRTENFGPRTSALEDQSPLLPMTMPERLMADFSGTSLTIGPHPMSMRRSELALRGVLRAVDLPRGRHGRRVRVAGAVITRQRPGTAKGFVFLTLEDETGIANIIVRPDLFSEQRVVIVQEPYLLVEGVLQIQEGVTSVRAERFSGLGGQAPTMEAHDFR
jgi:DNA polymerase III alpha subunit